MPTVRVTCPECDFTFSIADSRVGGLIACRDCKSEFRVEFAEEDEQPQPPAASPRNELSDRPPQPPAPRTQSRVDADHEPEGWKSDLPIRSPIPFLCILAGLQVLTAGFLVFNWFMPPSKASYSPTTSYYNSYPTTPKTVPTSRW